MWLLILCRSVNILVLVFTHSSVCLCWLIPWVYIKLIFWQFKILLYFECIIIKSVTISCWDVLVCALGGESKTPLEPAYDPVRGEKPKNFEFEVRFASSGKIVSVKSPHDNWNVKFIDDKSEAKVRKVGGWQDWIRCWMLRIILTLQMWYRSNWTNLSNACSNTKLLIHSNLDCYLM